MTIPEIQKDLYIFVEEDGRITRKGLLMYYDPLLLTDLYGLTLGELNTVDHTLPNIDSSIYDNFPDGINARKFDLTIG